MKTFSSIADFASAAGTELGTSRWFSVDQRQIDLFADATNDHQWIHVDPERAKDGPYGATIAHGYLTLSLLPQVLHDIYVVDAVRMAVNYGLNKVRFPSPVIVGSRIRGRAELLRVLELEGAVQGEISTIIEIEGSAKPACVAESIVRYSE